MAPKGTTDKEYIRNLEAVVLTQKDLISSQEKQLVNQEKQLSNQEKLISALEQKLERMNELLLNAQRARFGQSSEKRDYVMPNQLGIFNEAETEQDHKAPKPTGETLTVKEHQRKRKPKRTAEELTAGLPAKEVVLDLLEDERSCSACGHPLKQIGKKFLYEELEIIPQQVRVVKYYKARSERSGPSSMLQRFQSLHPQGVCRVGGHPPVPTGGEGQ